MKSQMKQTSLSSQRGNTIERAVRVMTWLFEKLQGRPEFVDSGVCQMQYPFSFERDCITLQLHKGWTELNQSSKSAEEIRIEGSEARKCFEVIREALIHLSIGSRHDESMLRELQHSLRGFEGKPDQVLRLEFEVGRSYLSSPNAPAHRRRANDARLSTETRSRLSVQPVCSTMFPSSHRKSVNVNAPGLLRYPNPAMNSTSQSVRLVEPE